MATNLFSFNFVVLRFRRTERIDCVSSGGYEFRSRGPVALRPWRPCSCSHSLTKHAYRTYPHNLVLSFSRLSNSGVVRDSDLDNTPAETLLGVVRVLPCIPSEQRHVVSLVSSRVEFFTFYFIQVSLPMPGVHTLFHPSTAGT